MLTHVQKWGNSLGVRIPAVMSKDLGIHNGSTVDIVVENHHLVIRPKPMTLDYMLSLFPKEASYQEEFEGADSVVGNEEW